MKQFILFISIVLPVTCFSQTRWHPFGGLHGSMDGGGYYAGVSYQAGTDYLLKKKITLSTYFHYFPKKVDFEYTTGAFQKGKYISALLAALVQTHLSKKERKGCFIAGGIAVQSTLEDYVLYPQQEQVYIKRTILVGAMRFGYLFTFSKRLFAIEMNAVGPHISKFGSPPYEGTQIELLTQLSGGIRVIF